MGTITLPSVYADMWLALDRLLGEADWPAPPVDGIKPVTVHLGGFGKDAQPVEAVLVNTNAAGVAGDQQTWGPIGRLRRDETFTTTVEVGTSIGKRTVRQALDRLAELTTVVESVVMSHVVNAPAELDGRMKWWSVISIDPTVVPLADGGGYGGYARITIAIEARIGGITA